jgi:hypothetical protein
MVGFLVICGLLYFAPRLIEAFLILLCVVLVIGLLGAIIGHLLLAAAVLAGIVCLIWVVHRRPLSSSLCLLMFAGLVVYAAPILI